MSSWTSDHRTSTTTINPSQSPPLNLFLCLIFTYCYLVRVSFVVPSCLLPCVIS